MTRARATGLPVPPDGRPHRAAAGDGRERHPAFCCWVVDGRGSTLLVQRSAAQRAWPGLWAPAVCGTPVPGESLASALDRRAREQLGTGLDRHVRVDGGTGADPGAVLTAVLGGTLRPDPAEVAHTRWMRVDALPSLLAASPGVFAPWTHRGLPFLTAVAVPALPDRSPSP